MVLPTKKDKPCPIDFVGDQHADGRRFRIFNIVNDFTRKCVSQLADTSISGARLTRFIDTLDRKPKTIVYDNGPELTRTAMFF